MNTSSVISTQFRSGLKLYGNIMMRTAWKKRKAKCNVIYWKLFSAGKSFGFKRREETQQQIALFVYEYFEKEAEKKKTTGGKNEEAMKMAE